MEFKTIDSETMLIFVNAFFDYLATNQEAYDKI